MSTPWTFNYDHLILVTEGRAPWITAEIEPALHAEIARIVKGLGCEVHAINGSVDHVHVVVRTGPEMPQRVCAETIMSGTQVWARESFAAIPGMEWGGGGKLGGWEAWYGGFTVSRGMLGSVVEFVKRQKRYHEGVTFEDEFVAMLTVHGRHATRDEVFGDGVFGDGGR